MSDRTDPVEHLNAELKHINADASVTVVHNITSATSVSVTVDPVKESESVNLHITI